VWKWLFFWQRKEIRQVEAPKALPEPSEKEAKSMSAPKEQLEESNDGKPLAVVHSISDRLRERQTIQLREVDSVDVLPAQTVSSITPIPAADKKQEVELLPANVTSDLEPFGQERLAYFTRGCYAVPGLRTCRLIAPQLSQRSERRLSLLQIGERDSKDTPAVSSTAQAPASKK
jgi:hypothetical protein